MGTYAPDRQEKLENLLGSTASQLSGMKFLIAGPQYPAEVKWPANVRRINHLSPRWHPHFYSSSRLTLNLTREHMVRAGFSPSVRLFEAAACGTTILSDEWPGLETFFSLGEEILAVRNSAEVVDVLKHMDEEEIRHIGHRGRERVLAEHSSAIRAEEFERKIASAGAQARQSSPRRGASTIRKLAPAPEQYQIVP
jgi:spore maturation protein CgeB